MKIIRIFPALLIAVLTFSFVNVNSQGISDLKSTQAIEREVFKKINSLPYYGVFDSISFKVEGSTVILSGKVYNAINKSSAQSAVKRIEGVKNVVNNIEVLPPSGFDNAIRRQLLRTFYQSGGSLYRYLLEPSPSMRIIVENGHVILEGNVATQGDSDLANILAKTVSGVFSVQNNLIVGKELYR
jgi:hypothetical protein